MTSILKKRAIVWGIIVLVVVNISSLATIWFHKYQGRRHHAGYYVAPKSRLRQEGQHMSISHRFERVLKRELNLSDFQITQLDSIKTTLKLRAPKEGSDIINTRKALADAMSKPIVDTILVEQLLAQEVAKFEKMNRAMVDMNFAIRSILNKEQLSDFLKLLEEMKERRELSSTHRGNRSVPKHRSENYSEPINSNN